MSTEKIFLFGGTNDIFYNLIKSFALIHIMMSKLEFAMDFFSGFGNIFDKMRAQ